MIMYYFYFFSFSGIEIKLLHLSFVYDFSNLNSDCSNLFDMRKLQEQDKKAFCYQKLFWPFTVWINCSSDLKKFENSRPSASNFKSFSQSLNQFFLTVGQNNFGNKIPLITKLTQILSQNISVAKCLLNLKLEVQGSWFSNSSHNFISKYVLYWRHFNPLVITNRSWVLTINKDKIFKKKNLENKEIFFKKQLEKI